MMREKKYLLLLTPFFIWSYNAQASEIYANNISAENINILTVEFMENAHHGDNILDSSKNSNIYGKMTRFDEYGDDGRTIKTKHSQNYNDTLVKDIWIDEKYLNNKYKFNHHLSQRIQNNIVSVGFDSLDFNVIYGDISFGAYFSYINSDTKIFDNNGQSVGLFTKYKYKDFTVTGMINNGTTTNDFDNNKDDFNNAWFNAAIDASLKLRFQSTLYLQPEIYFGYTYVKPDDKIHINEDYISAKNSRFWNIAPSVKIVSRITDNLSGALFFKYVDINSKNNDIVFQNIKYPTVNIDQYDEIGLSARYNYNKLMFDVVLKKTFGNIDGFGGNLNIKYLF